MGAQHRSPPPAWSDAARIPAGRMEERKMKGSCLPRIASVPACVVIFFFGFHVRELDCAEFRVLGPDHPVTAVVGEDVVLPCHLSPRLNAENMEVRWFRSSFSSYVHLYRSGQDHHSSQMPEYQERTEFLKEGISIGNASLRILGTRLSDEGQYHCLIKDGDFYEEATLELKVAVSGSSPLLSVEDYQDGGIRVGCCATGWYPKPEVLWRDFQGQQLPSFTQSDSRDQNGFFEVETSIVIQRNANQKVSCSVRNTRLPQEKDTSIYVSDPIFPKDCPWKATLVATLAICFVSLVVFSVVILRLRARHTAELGKRDAEIRLRDMEIEKHTAELRWRNTDVPVEEVYLTLDKDTAHPQLILEGGVKILRWQPVLDDPGGDDTCNCVLALEEFVSGRWFWEVDVGTDKRGIWAVGVIKYTTKRKGRIKAPRDRFLALFYYGGVYWAMTSPDQTALNLTQLPRNIRVCLDFEVQNVAFFNADNKELLCIFPLGPLSGERIRPCFCVGPMTELILKSPPSPLRDPSVEEPLLPSSFPLQSLPKREPAPRHQRAGRDQDGEIHVAVPEQP